MFEERALTIPCDGHCMVAIAHVPDPGSRHGVLIVVGGPQYRAGSHRQFVLLARFLAARGVAVLRFDHRGIGDSSGASPGFEALEKDIGCAVDRFFHLCPELENVYIWGLCDAASAALIYGHTDARIAGLILLNPWVRTEAGLAKAFLKTYYLRQVRNPAFWRDLLAGRRGVWKSLRSFTENLLRTKGGDPGAAAELRGEGSRDKAPPREHFLHAMLRGLQGYRGRVLIIIAGEDVTGIEFRSLVNSSRQWKRAFKRLKPTWVEIAGANHTFSRHAWRTQVEQVTADWIIAE